MSSENPVIAVRLPPEVYKRVQVAAGVEGRSLSNFAARALAIYLAHPPEQAFRQVDLEELTGAPPRAVERGPQGRTARQPRRGK